MPALLEELRPHRRGIVGLVWAFSLAIAQLGDALVAVVLWLVGVGFAVWLVVDSWRLGRRMIAGLTGVGSLVASVYVMVLILYKSYLDMFYTQAPEFLGNFLSDVTLRLSSLPSSTWMVLGASIGVNMMSAWMRKSLDARITSKSPPLAPSADDAEPYMNAAMVAKIQRSLLESKSDKPVPAVERMLTLVNPVEVIGPARCLKARLNVRVWRVHKQSNGSLEQYMRELEYTGCYSVKWTPETGITIHLLRSYFPANRPQQEDTNHFFNDGRRHSMQVEHAEQHKTSAQVILWNRDESGEFCAEAAISYVSAGSTELSGHPSDGSYPLPWTGNGARIVMPIDRWKSGIVCLATMDPRPQEFTWEARMSLMGLVNVSMWVSQS